MTNNTISDKEHIGIINYKVYFWTTISVPALLIIIGLSGLYLYSLDFIGESRFIEEIIANGINRGFGLMGLALIYIVTSILLNLVNGMEKNK